METKMDSFFKKKLEEHSLPPREDAWARVEAKLPKKNNAFAWRIAAAILVAGALIWVGMLNVRKSETSTLARKTEPAKSVDSLSHQDASTQTQSGEEKNLRDAEEIKSQHLANSTYTAKNLRTRHEVASDDRLQRQKNIVQQRAEEKNRIAENESENQPSVSAPLREANIEKQNLKSDATALAQTTSIPTEKPIKLEFTLEDVAADQTAVAKTDTKNSGLWKMWEAAIHLKNGEGPVNQLLEKKDELFALNFKKRETKKSTLT